MKIPELREESRSEYLDRVFCRLRAGGDISLWQNLHTTRNTQKAILYKIAGRSNILNFMPAEGESFRFDSRRPIYFYEKKGLILFKSRIIFHSVFRLEIPYPERILAPEQRAMERTIPDELENEHVKFELRNTLGAAPYEKPLIDFNESGASFRISEQDRNVFIHTSILRMSPPHQRARLVNAKIRYIELLQDGKHSGSRFYRVGVKYQN